MTRVFILAAAFASSGANAADDPTPTVPPIEFRVIEPARDATLAPFYKKLVKVGDLPVLASEKVSDFALFEAAYLIREMLLDRPDVLAAMAKEGVRFSIMGVRERTTDVPEHSDLVPGRYWDRRARGLGPNPGRPSVSCGEENLLKLSGDPYAQESILIHEFGHAIHDMGMKFVDPSFDGRLRKTYESATAKGLWKGKYAAVNHHEYWAEGVQSWFDTNRHDDHDHNHVDTRPELEAYDPDLAKLVHETLRRTDWKYVRPADRKDSGHLAGFDPAKAPAFDWARDGRADRGQVLDKLDVLRRQTFWDNRDWDWYARNIPILETPDTELDTTYYYRWELLTKHLTYGSPNSGYSFTEFIDRPFWSGRYGAISCPAGHQLYESRWLRDPTIARDYARYWIETPGAQPRRYSTWLADAAWAVHRVHPNDNFAKSLLTGLRSNHEGWEKSHLDAKVGLFAQSGHDDGMEFNISSRQTKDILRGDWGFRPTLNSYLWADARAIAKIARLAGDVETADTYESKAATLKSNLQEKLWDEKRSFYFPMSARDEVLGDHVVKAGTLTYQSGRFAGDPHGRELIGFVPWQFGLPDPGREEAWKGLLDPEVFYAEFGPTVTERHDPLFLVTDHCCWWSGQSWPYATSQTLTAMANLLNDYDRQVVSKADFAKLFKVYTKTHRKNGKPYLAEGVNPDSGDWKGYDSPGHSDHYFHSSYNDLVISGLIGLRPGDGDAVVVNPLAHEDWDYFALDDVAFKGHRLSIVWDRDGSRYDLGKGLRVIVDGRTIATRDSLGKLTFDLPRIEVPVAPLVVNYAVNNDGTAYPRAFASHTSDGTSLAKLIDGNAWYHIQPPNRWTSEGSSSDRDHCGVDFGTPRPIDSVALKFLDDGDGKGVTAPRSVTIETWDGERWQRVRDIVAPGSPEGRMANWYAFPEIRTSKIRAVFDNGPNGKPGLTEFEAWGGGKRPIKPAPSEPGNIAEGAKVTASFTSRFDKVGEVTDGIIGFTPEPRNRWTAYESPNAEDWLSLDLDQEHEIGRVDLLIFDDGGGVRAPKSYLIQTWDGVAWQDVSRPRHAPPAPSGGTINVVTFTPTKTGRVRVIFKHREGAKSGVTEMELRAR